MLSLGHLTHYWHHQWHTSNICTKRLRSDQTGGDPQFGSFRSPFPPSSTRQLQQQSSYHKSQGDFNCGSSSQAGFILNYFLSNIPSSSPFPPSPAGRLEQSEPLCLLTYYSGQVQWSCNPKNQCKLDITHQCKFYLVVSSTWCENNPQS